MLNIELLKQILVIAIASGVITTLSVQKIKEMVKKKKLLFYISFGISMIIGTLFAKSFSTANWLYCLWCGFFTFIDANLIYEMLEEKVFTRFKDMENVIILERNDK